ncbi:MAG TPA: response regulator [Xanthobacteraceae bacterium]|jgi:DNA-binding response OmpR family regulator|nr:response regulator [Xanthobacteraceae bacterium]
MLARCEAFAMACILVIDDDRAVRATIKTWLEIEDHEVVVAKDGRDGFKKIETDHFDLLIVDIFMPVMDGLEMIRLVHQRKPELPIIVISGFTVRSSSVSAPDFLAMATKLGGACSLHKPFNPRELSAAVNECLARPVSGQRSAARPMTQQGRGPFGG